MKKKNKLKKRLTFSRLKQFSRLLFAFLSSVIIIVNCKEEDKKKQLEIDNERMEAFFEGFDEDALAMNSKETIIVSENLFSDYTKKTKFREYKLAIEEYSLYFNLDSDKVFEFTKDLTNDFEEPLTITIGRKTFTATTVDDTAMFITYDIWKDIYNTRDSLKKYHLEEEDYVISREITHIERNQNGEIIMRNGLTLNQMLGKASYAIDKSPALALAISDHESGYRTNAQTLNQNNISGMRGKGIPGVSDNGFATFPSIEAGIIYHVFNLERMENSFNCSNLYQFASIYVWGTKTIPADNWFKDVSDKSARYAANEEYYFGIPEEEPVRVLAYKID